MGWRGGLAGWWGRGATGAVGGDVFEVQAGHPVDGLVEHVLRHRRHVQPAAPAVSDGSAAVRVVGEVVLGVGAGWCCFTGRSPNSSGRSCRL